MTVSIFYDVEKDLEKFMEFLSVEGSRVDSTFNQASIVLNWIDIEVALKDSSEQLDDRYDRGIFTSDFSYAGQSI
ncbi:hypothetical protein K0M31_010217 [Melipona bicolor]|uniref:Uncharacterized protein n=1 Tax=Melipona bicolor TaxID=60889 RepID=A0AA40FLK4_9HYME|nr:hypothetical protein K0M31_010217 [Melipona bicolor]